MESFTGTGYTVQILCGMLQPLYGMCLYVVCIGAMWDFTASMWAVEASVWDATSSMWTITVVMRVAHPLCGLCILHMGCFNLYWAVAGTVCAIADSMQTLKVTIRAVNPLCGTLNPLRRLLHPPFGML